MVFHPHPSVDVIVQALRGKARVQTLTNDSDLRAFYALSFASLPGTIDSASVTTSFRVEDVDGATRRTNAATVSRPTYFYEWGLRHRIGLEYLWINSRRPASSPRSNFPRTAGKSAIVSATDRRPCRDLIRTP